MLTKCSHLFAIGKFQYANRCVICVPTENGLNHISRIRAERMNCKDVVT